MAENKTESKTSDSEVSLSDLLGCTPNVASKILAAREAIIQGDEDEAYYQLYLIASPGLIKTRPWEDLEKLAAT